MLVKMSVPPWVKVPVMNTRSFVSAPPFLLNSIKVLLPSSKLTLLLMVNVPMPLVPGASAPPLCTVAALLMTPVPPSVALVARNAGRTAHLQLLRAIGLRLDTELELTDRMQYAPVDAVTMEQARAQALQQRPDLKAQQDRESTARLSASATRIDRKSVV